MINKAEREVCVGSAAYNLAKLPGKHANTVLLLAENAGYSFVIEMIDRYRGKSIYELTICTYDNETEMNRHEYVLTCNKKSLRDLRDVIDKILK